MDWVDLYSRKETDEMKQSNKSGKADKNTNKNADHKKKKSRTVAGILALFTGAIGLHKFYLGEWKTGLLWVLFFWTGVPWILGLIEGSHLLGADEEPA